VLSREEYNELLLSGLNTMGDLVSSKIKNKYKEKIEKLEETINEEYADISDYKDLVCKETAEKFLNMIYWKAVKHIKGKNKDECFIEMSFEKLDELAKQFGVEIKE
jgi:hypothetical protein